MQHAAGDLIIAGLRMPKRSSRAPNSSTIAIESTSRQLVRQLGSVVIESALSSIPSVATTTSTDVGRRGSINAHRCARQLRRRKTAPDRRASSGSGRCGYGATPSEPPLPRCSGNRGRVARNPGRLLHSRQPAQPSGLSQPPARPHPWATAAV